MCARGGIMSRNNYTINDLSKILTPIFKNYNIGKAIVFGSVAKGTSKTNSDIDILVDSNLKGMKFIGLIEDVKEAVNCEIDMFDITHITPDSSILHEINDTGIVIYEKQ